MHFCSCRNHCTYEMTWHASNRLSSGELWLVQSIESINIKIQLPRFVSFSDIGIFSKLRYIFVVGARENGWFLCIISDSCIQFRIAFDFVWITNFICQPILSWNVIANMCTDSGSMHRRCRGCSPTFKVVCIFDSTKREIYDQQSNNRIIGGINQWKNWKSSWWITYRNSRVIIEEEWILKWNENDEDIQ